MSGRELEYLKILSLLYRGQSHKVDVDEECACVRSNAPISLRWHLLIVPSEYAIVGMVFEAAIDFHNYG